MNSQAQIMAGGLAASLVPDPQDISLSELASMARRGDGAILDIVARMAGEPEGPPLLPAMMFNSAI